MTDAVLLYLSMFSVFPACCCAWSGAWCWMCGARKRWKILMQATKMTRRATAKTVTTLAFYSLCSQRDTRAKSRASVQMKASTAQTRLVVTIWWYLRWKNKAAYRSRLIAAKFKSEAVVKMDAVTTSESWSEHWTMSGKFPRRKRNAAHWGATTEPAPRSVSTREQSKSLDGRRMDVTWRIASRTTRLATVVATASGTFKAAFIKYGSDVSKLSKISFGKGAQTRKFSGIIAVGLPWPVGWLNGKDESFGAILV